MGRGQDIYFVIPTVVKYFGTDACSLYGSDNFRKYYYTTSKNTKMLLLVFCYTNIEPAHY